MAYEDFTTYTEVDEGNDIVIDSATQISWTNLVPRSDTGYVYKDKGVDYFWRDFTHRFEMYFYLATVSTFVVNWMVSNIVGDRQDVIDASGDAILISQYCPDTIYEVNITLELIENGVSSYYTWVYPGPQEYTTYFVEVIRDDDGGVNGTGRVTATFRTGSHSGPIQSGGSRDCGVGEQNDFRYIYALATNDQDYSLNFTNGNIQNLELIGDASTTAVPTTVGPTTIASTTITPTTLAPTTLAPTTSISDTTSVPTTSNYTTLVPTTVDVATTDVPTTSAPTTLAPTTIGPTSLAPSTAVPTTTLTTAIPTTAGPTTVGPTTIAPTTLAPTTIAPTSPAPTTITIELVCTIRLNSPITKELSINGNLC